MSSETKNTKEKTHGEKSREDIPGYEHLPKTENYYLPEEIVFALSKQEHPPADTVRSGSSIKRLTGTSRKRPDNVWHHKRREKFKHLMDDTLCICGAGKDVSFLYDALVSEKSGLYFKGLQEELELKGVASPRKLPFELFPEEYHLVTSESVRPLKYQEEPFSIMTEDHKKHFTQFPPLKPNSRFEVIKLRNSMYNMLNKAGLNEFSKVMHTSTQMHQFVELVKKEQDIYNVIFHEIIRQVSVDCIERGDLLAEIRRRYSDILQRIPQLMKGLYEEVLSQRAVDRRLTEELIRFKNSLILLTDELSLVKAQDIKLAEEINTTRKALKIALFESAKNANMLKEYQELYDLQRHRLEKQVTNTTLERDLWCKTTYNIAIKVVEESDLIIAKRLINCEKQWFKIAQHYAIYLSDTDTSNIILIQDLLEGWKVEMEEYFLDISQWEERSRIRLKSLQSEIEYQTAEFKNNYENSTKISMADYIHVLDEFAKKMISWEQIVTEESCNYQGELILKRMEKMKLMSNLKEEWKNLCFKLIQRHQPSKTQRTKMSAAYKKMTELFDVLKTQNMILLTGENGASDAIIRLTQKLNEWIKRLNIITKDPRRLDSDEEENLFEVFPVMIELVNRLLKSIGVVERREKQSLTRENSRVSIFAVVQSGFEWFTIISQVIDSQDARLIDQVTQLHLKIVMWTCHLLIQLCPDRSTCTKESLEVLYATYPSAEEVIKEGVIIFALITKLTGKIARDVIEMQNITKYFPPEVCSVLTSFGKMTKTFSLEDAETHNRAIAQMKDDCDRWIYTAKLLLSDIMNQHLLHIFPNIKQTVAKEVEDIPEEDKDPNMKGLMEKLTIPPYDDFQIPDQIAERSAEESMKSIYMVKVVELEENLKTESGEKNIQKSLSYKDENVIESSSDRTPKETEKSKELLKSVEVQTEEGIQTPYSEEEWLATIAKLGKPRKYDQKYSIGVPQRGFLKQLSSTIIEQPAEEDFIEVIGSDGITYCKELDYTRLQVPDELSSKEAELNAPNTSNAYIALNTVKMLQEQLLMTEKRAQNLEDRAERAEAEIMYYRELLRIATEKTATEVNFHENSDENSDEEIDVNLSATPASHKGRKPVSLSSQQTGKTPKKSSMKTTKSKKK